MSLLPHEQRMIAERDQLNDRIDKLDAFLAGLSDGKLPTLDVVLMYDQSAAMKMYRSALQARISRFERGGQ